MKMQPLLLVAACAVAAGASKGPKTVFTILIDDLGFYDTAVHNEDIKYVTPNLHALSHDAGLRLDRFYTFLYCSPTRRALLAGRYPVHMSADQAQPCSNDLPWNLTILPQKLKQAAVPWAAHFIGKGHLGYPTTDHLPINRGFDSHAGYLAGAEDYDHGLNYNKDGHHDCAGTPKQCVHDFWHDKAPGTDVVEEIYYSTNWYTERAQNIVVEHSTNPETKDKPLWVHLMYQGVHSPYVDAPSWEGIPEGTTFWDKTFGDMLNVVDTGIGNITATLKAQGMWDDALLIITSDNGGIGPGNNYPLRGMKTTAWEGGTRVMGFLTGGYLPSSLYGKTFPTMIGVQDWYPTICGLAGVDPTDDVEFRGKVRPIDGVDVWPSIMALADASDASAAYVAAQNEVLHEYFPTTDASIIWKSQWKLLVSESSTHWYTPNATMIPDDRKDWPCLPNDASASFIPPRDWDKERAEAQFVTAQSRKGSISYKPKCHVCTPTHPCLFDLFKDPEERLNLAGENPDIVSQLKAKHATFSAYIGDPLTPGELAPYECVADIRPWWGNFSGPCCRPKAGGKTSA